VSLRVVAVCAALVGVVGTMSAATAQTAIRIDDGEVAEQMEQVQRGLDRFIGGLGPAGRTADLTSLRTSASRMAAAYRPPTNNATDEVVRFLAQAKAVEAGLPVAQDMDGTGARWRPVVDTVVHLAQAYHIDWRVDAARWVPHRVSNQELRLACSSVRVAAHDLDETLGEMLEKDKAMDSTENARARRLLEALTSAVRDLLKAFEHYDDLSERLPRALRAAASLKPFMETDPGALRLQPQWQSVNLALGTIARGFGM
jgi:hypothetical protein